MTTYKIAELEGALLDAAVAKADGKLARIDFYPGDGLSPIWKCRLFWRTASGGEASETYAPSTLWEVGGPIIQRERITVHPHDFGRKWAARLAGKPWGEWDSAGRFEFNEPDAIAPTPLIAAMRAYVASRFGETLELP